MNRVIIMRGIPGSGKSHYVRENYPDAVVCSADEFFMVDGEYQFDPTRIGQAHSFCLAKFIDAVKRGVPEIVVDNTNVHQWEFVNYKAIANLGNYEIEIVDVRVDTIDQLRTCIERNSHGVPADIVSRMAVEMEVHRDGDCHGTEIDVK